MRLRSLGEIVSHILFPRACPLCGEPGRFVCEACLSDVLEPPSPLPRCAACGGPSPCGRHGTRYELRARCIHRDAARELLLAAKYGGAGQLARRLGEELAVLAPQGEGWTITAIPEHPHVSWLPRGGSHLDWMARGLRARTGFAVRDLLRWNIRVRPQKQQPDARSRRALPRGCFACTSTPPERVILIDDVSTTGTTLERAVSCLYDAGAKEVLCLCWSVAVR